MAQYPKIRIEVASVPTVDGASLYIRLGTLEYQSYYILLNSSLTAPAGFMKYYVGLTTSACKQNILSALTAAYGAPFIFKSVDGIDAIDISVESYELGDLTASIQNESDFNVTITPVIPPVQFGITGITYSQATDNICNNVKVTAAIENGTAPYTVRAIYNGGIQESKNTSDPADFFFDFPRYSTGSRRIEIISGADVKSIDVGIVKRVLSIDVLIAYSVGGATITINPNQSAGTVNITPFQFSIDDIVFQASNVFEIAVSGNFTAYVVDKYGCKKSVGFTISLEERKADPYFKIEITNPLRVVDQNYTGIKNITNQLSANIDLANIESRFYRQPFRIGDIARTQIKANYETLAVKIYNCNDELVDTLTPELKIENINQLDKRSVIIAPGEAGQTHVAMTTGTIYDPVTGDAIDTYYQSGGRLPSFVRVGMLMTFSDSHLSGTFEVKEIAYNELLEAWVCVIDANYTFAAIEVVVLNTYNLEEYNIYEVEITLNEGQYYAIFEATDSSEAYPDVSWKSEPFWFSDDSEVVVIDYTSEINEALIDYRTGVEFRLCVPGRFVKYQPDIQGEDFRDDLGNIYLQKSTYNRAWMIETDLLPWWLAEKVMIASRHKNLKIDGIKVVNTEAPEITDRLGDRNPFYQITGTYQENIDISISDETGIISGSRGILSGNENTVIGI